MLNKKAQAQGAVGAVIALIVGVGVAVLVLVFVGVLGGQAYDISEDDINDIANNVVTGDDFTMINGTKATLDHSFIQEGTLSFYNTTAPYFEWSLNNFTIDYDEGSLQMVGLSDNGNMTPMNNTVIYANYTWGAREVRTGVQESIVSGFSALENAGDYLPLVVLGIVIFVVLGLVFGMTAFSRTGGGGTAL